MTKMHNEKLMTELELAQILGIKQRTLQSWRLREKGPPSMKLTDRVIRYRISDVEAWLQDQTKRSTKQKSTA